MISTRTKSTTGKRLPSPTPLPSLHDAERAAFRAGWWNGKVIGFALGLGTAVLMGWLR